MPSFSRCSGVLHFPLLRLPYFWDEAGYYVPAARDLLLTGSLIPHSTPSNAHPPLVMAYVALWWKVFGFAPLITRTPCWWLRHFLYWGCSAWPKTVANREVAAAATLCTALYPVVFAQSSLVHLDLVAAGLTFWGLGEYIKQRPSQTALWFSLATLAKETAILAPLALFAWELFSMLWPAGDDPRTEPQEDGDTGSPVRNSFRFCRRFCR